jgi:hypothetical protein
MEFDVIYGSPESLPVRVSAPSIDIVTKESIIPHAQRAPSKHENRLYYTFSSYLHTRRSVSKWCC